MASLLLNVALRNNFNQPLHHLSRRTFQYSPVFNGLKSDIYLPNNGFGFENGF